MMDNRKIQFGLRLLLALVMMSGLVLAWQGMRSVKGVVCDQNGNPLEGAIVQSENTRTSRIRSYVTQRDGTYQFHRLNSNVDYELSAVYSAVSSSVKTLSSFEERPVAVVNLRIRIE